MTVYPFFFWKCQQASCNRQSRVIFGMYHHIWEAPFYEHRRRLVSEWKFRIRLENSAHCWGMVEASFPPTISSTPLGDYPRNFIRRYQKALLFTSIASPTGMFLNSERKERVTKFVYRFYWIWFCRFSLVIEVSSLQDVFDVFRPGTAISLQAGFQHRQWMVKAICQVKCSIFLTAPLLQLVYSRL